MTLAEALARAAKLQRRPRRYTPTAGQGPTFDPPGATPPPEPPAEAAGEEEEPEEESVECPNCGESYPDDEDFHTVREGGSDQQVCQDCYDSGYSFCPGCENVVPDDEMNEAQGRGYGRGEQRSDHSACDECIRGNYTRCADCASYFPDDQEGAGQDDQGDGVCRNCAENYFTCDDCGETFPNDDYGSEGRCEDCSREDEEDEESDDPEEQSGRINPYSYKPAPIFHGDPKERHYGVELEAVQKQGSLHDAAGDVLDKLNRGLGKHGFAYLKADSSVTDAARAKGWVGGFEIVTHPATLDVHKERWPAVLAPNAPQGLVSHDAGVGVGLHVHVERTGLSQLTIGKMLALVNARQNRPYLEALARRPNSTAWAAMKDEKKPSDALRPATSRYEALNLNPGKTIEFRFFRGTLKPDSFFRALEFADAATEFAKPARHSIADMVGLRPFFEFVAKNAKRYPHLAQFNAHYLGQHPLPAPARIERLSRRAEPLPRGVRMSVVLSVPPRRRPVDPWAAVARALAGGR